MFSYFSILALLTVLSSATLTVKTRTGILSGNLNDTYPDVRQFLWIPYAKPPVGHKRWTPPERLDNSSAAYESSTFGPSCSQYVSAIPTAWTLNITGNLVVNYGESLLAGLVAQNSAEDCLSLAVWTPANATANEKLPVVIYTTGGGFVTGGVNIPTQLPAEWVHRSQKHIIVTINYRVNIFSYPNARGLKGSTNFASQDQRMAVEWAAENIAAFGGDPARITLWGQSAGAALTDYYTFTYYDNPIIQASVSSSGSVYFPINQDYSGTNFTFVARSLGCDFEDAALELDCMRRVPMPLIENFIGQYQDNSTLVNTSQPSISFTPQVDEKLIFSNYTKRYYDGKIAKIPHIEGSTAREGSPFAPYPIPYTAAGPSVAASDAFTLLIVCAAYNNSVLRAETGLTTYRYQWAGNFSDLTGGVPWLGAYHYSDLYMFFGTYLITPGMFTELEAMTSARMQDLLYAFMADPTSLPAQDWPEYKVLDKDGGRLVRFGADGKVSQIVNGDAVEGACHIPGDVLNTSP